MTTSVGSRSGLSWSIRGQIVMRAGEDLGAYWLDWRHLGNHKKREEKGSEREKKENRERKKREKKE